MPATPALGRYRQEDREFKVMLSYTVGLRLAWAPLLQRNKQANSMKGLTPLFQPVQEDLQGQLTTNMGSAAEGSSEPQHPLPEGRWARASLRQEEGLGSLVPLFPPQHPPYSSEASGKGSTDRSRNGDPTPHSGANQGPQLTPRFCLNGIGTWP